MSDSSDFHFVGFNKYTRDKPKENNYKKWVVNGHKDGVFNSNYQNIINAYNGSTTNRAINNSYIKMAYGRGLAIHDKETDTLELQKFHEKISKKDLRNLIFDNQLLSEYSFVIHRQSGASKGKLANIEHISKSNVIPSVADENGVIRSYWYSADWTKQYQNKYKPVEYPALGFAEDFEYEKPEIYVGMQYQIGQEYFSQPDYEACLQYCFIEEEISNYYYSHIQNGLSFGSIVNIPNSAHWTDEQKKGYVNDVIGRYTGSQNTNKIAFNFMGADANPSTITNVENNTAHKQWDFLTKEASNKIISGHECPSPSIVGLSSATGFSSKADEMDMMEQQIMKRVIAPKQDFVLDGVREVFEYFNEEFPDVYFRPLTEIEGEDEEKKKVNEKDVEQEVEMSKKKSELDKFIDLGENEDLEIYDIIDENEVDYNEEIQFVSTGVARPNSKSSQDNDDIIIRYRYVGNKTPERSFCKSMMNANKIYRKEDIEQLSNKVVNAGWGPNGVDKYSIWLYKGGGNCHHKWNRVIYLKKGKSVDVNSPLAEIISTSEARRKGYKVETNDTKVSVEPRNMTNKGFLKKR